MFVRAIISKCSKLPIYIFCFTQTIMETPRRGKAPNLGYVRPTRTTKRSITTSELSGRAPVYVPKPKPEKEKKQRGPRYSDDLYDSLINVVLNHKKSIKPTKIVTGAQARKFVERNEGYTFQDEEDIDGDGLNDVIVYDRNQKPHIVNGYMLKESTYPHRRDYILGNREVDLDGDGTKDARGTFREYTRGAYGYKPGDDIFDDATIREEGPYPEYKLQEYYDAGYAKVRKPRTELTVYQMFVKFVAPMVKEALASLRASEVTKLVKLMKIYNMLYLNFIEGAFFNNTDGQFTDYEAMKSYLRTDNGKANFKQWFRENARELINTPSVVNFFQMEVDGDALLNSIFQDYSNGGRLGEFLNDVDDLKKGTRNEQLMIRRKFDEFGPIVADRIDNLVISFKNSLSSTYARSLSETPRAKWLD